MNYEFFFSGIILLLMAVSLPGMYIARAMEVENVKMSALATCDKVRQRCAAAAVRAFWWYELFSFASGLYVFLLVWLLTSFSFIFLALPVFILLYEGAISCALGVSFFEVRDSVFLADWWHKAADPERARTVFFLQWVVAAGILFAYNTRFAEVETLLLT